MEDSSAAAAPARGGGGGDGEVVFTNELGNIVTMRVSVPETGRVLVFAEGPTSHTEHVWTTEEARHLKKMLEKVLPAGAPIS